MSHPFRSLLVAGLAVVTLAAAAPASATAVSSSDVPKVIPDLGTAVSTLTFPSMTIGDVNLIIDELRHTSILDLAFELTSPGGTTKLLVASFNAGGILSSIGAFRADLVGTTFDDEAPVNLLTAVSNNANAPFPGSFNIDHPSVGTSPLSVFDGQNAGGIWTLRVLDELGGDSGSLVGWSLDITAASVPEPGSALLVLGALGLVALRRRQVQ